MSKAFIFLLFLPLAFSVCPSKVIFASSGTSKIELSPGELEDPLFIPRLAPYAEIEGAPWVWRLSFDTVGTFKFVSTFSIPEWMRERIATLTLTLAADNCYSIDFNGESIAPAWSGGFGPGQTYELKEKFLGSSGQIGKVVNRLEIAVFNPDGYGGLAYKVELTYK